MITRMKIDNSEVDGEVEDIGNFLWLIWLNIQESDKQQQSDDEDFLGEYTGQ